MFVHRAYLYVVCLVLIPTARCQLTGQTSGLDNYTVAQAEYDGVGSSEIVKTYRRGAQVLVEINRETGSQKYHKRALVDLNEKQSLEWNLDERDLDCSKVSFDGEAGWHGPFLDLPAMMERRNLRQIGTEILHGWTANIFEYDVDERGQKKARIWTDSKSNLQLMTQVDNEDSLPPLTTSEVLDVNYELPPASLFVPPKQCAAAFAGPRVPTRQDRIAEATSSNALDFEEVEPLATSKTSCDVIFRVVRWGSMEPIDSGFRVGLDLTSDSHSYFFSDRYLGGGGLREVTSQLRDNSLRIGAAPAHFSLEAVFSDRSGGHIGPITGMSMGRRCFGPETTLLLVIKKNASTKTKDEHVWLWVKSGKYATP